MEEYSRRERANDRREVGRVYMNSLESTSVVRWKVWSTLLTYFFVS